MRELEVVLLFPWPVVKEFLCMSTSLTISASVVATREPRVPLGIPEIPSPSSEEATGSLPSVEEARRSLQKPLIMLPQRLIDCESVAMLQMDKVVETALPEGLEFME